jgi:hypothetical protein
MRILPEGNPVLAEGFILHAGRCCLCLVYAPFCSRAGPICTKAISLAGLVAAGGNLKHLIVNQ